MRTQGLRIQIVIVLLALTVCLCRLCGEDRLFEVLCSEFFAPVQAE